MWFWWHDYFASKNHIIPGWLDVNYLSAELPDRGLYLRPQDYVSLGRPAKIYNWIFSSRAEKILIAGMFSNSWNRKNRWRERIPNQRKRVQNWREHILRSEKSNSNENSGVQKVRNRINFPTKCWGWQPTQTSSWIHIRHMKSVWAHWYAVHGHMAVASNSNTYTSWVIFWGSGSLVESKWCHYVMIEAVNLYKLLPASTLDICKVIEQIYMLSMGIWQ